MIADVPTVKPTLRARALRVLEHGPTGPQQVAFLLGINESQAGGVLHGLAERGLVERLTRGVYGKTPA